MTVNVVEVRWAEKATVAVVFEGEEYRVMAGTAVMEEIEDLEVMAEAFVVQAVREATTVTVATRGLGDTTVEATTG